MINSGPGPRASDAQTAYWQSLTQELEAVDADLNKALGDLRATWQGKAADSANTGMTPLQAWASDAQTGSTVMRLSTEDQAQFISRARAEMPKPVEVTTPAPSVWDMAGAGAMAVLGNPGPAAAVAAQAADNERQEAAKNAAADKAVDTMNSYQSNSTWNRNTLGTFEPPPDVVVSTPPPAGQIGGWLRAEGYAVPVADGTTTSSSITTLGTSGGTNGPAPVSSGVSGGLGPSGSGGGGSGVGVAPLPPGGSTTPSGLLPPTTGPASGSNPPNSPVRPGLPGGGGTGPGGGGNPNLITGGGPFPGSLPGKDNDKNSGTGRGPLQGIRGGMPGLGGFGPEGSRSGAGGPGMPGGLGGPGGLDQDSSRAAQQLGRGGATGVGGALGTGGGEGVVARGGAGAGGGAGARGGGFGATPMGAGGRAAGDEDEEHFAPDYLLETTDVFGDDRMVSPAVIGENPTQDEK